MVRKLLTIHAVANLLKADLGLDRRENIVTSEFRHYREASGKALESLRASNKPGTKEYKVAQQNKAAINAWSCKLYPS
jgi:hypothetical protein